MLENYQEANGKLDLPSDMLNQARLNHSTVALKERISIEQRNIEDLGSIPNDSFDVCFNFHNLMVFVDNPEKALSELERIIKPRGALEEL